MKTFKKAILLVVFAALLVGVSIMGTLAFLQDETDTITNTMTVGQVKITLDESVLDQDGNATDERTTTGNSYKLIPGQTYIKDPVVHVSEDSESCYLFVKVVNGIENIEDGIKIVDQMAANGWKPVANELNVYYNETVAKASDKVKVFENFTIASSLDDDLSAYADATIEITAYAVQAAGFDDAAEAWAATFDTKQG